MTVQYPEQKPYLSPRIAAASSFRAIRMAVSAAWPAILRGRCPVDCIALQATEDENGRRYPEFFRINFSRCIFCGFCEEACPTYAIQLTPDFEMGEYHRQNLVYEKEDLLISGPGKYPGYNYWRVAGVRIGGKGQGRGRERRPPVDLHRLCRERLSWTSPSISRRPWPSSPRR